MKTIVVKTQKVLVDDDDFESLNQYTWHLNRGYVRTSIKWKEDGRRQKHILLHHLVLSPKKGFCIDHINQNPLDNRKENLRHATLQVNRFNSSKTKGISFDEMNGKYKRNKPWRAHIYPGNKHISLGCFKTKEEALEARRKAVQMYL